MDKVAPSKDTNTKFQIQQPFAREEAILMQLKAPKEYVPMGGKRDKSAESSDSQNSLSGSKAKIQDFSKAFKEVAKQIYEEQPSMVSGKDLYQLAKIEQMSTVHTDKVVERLYSFQKQKEEKIQKSRNELTTLSELQETEEFNFHPQILKAEDDKTRSKQELLNDLYEYEAVKKQRQNNRVKEANDTAVTNPVALKASKRMLEGKLKEPVFERLSKKPEPVKKEQVEAENSINVANISLHRGAPISDALYDLHKIKQQNQIAKQEQKEKQKIEKLQKEVEQNRSQTNNKFLQKKFEKEFRVVLQNMASQEQNWQEDRPVPFRPCGSVLTTLGFLPQDMAETSEDYLLFQELWDLLEGAKRDGIYVNSLLYFLLIIRGVKMPEKEVEIDKTDAFLKIAKMDEGGNLIVAPGGQKKLCLHFKKLYVNRIQFEGQNTQVKTAQIDISKSAKPEISKRSQDLAQNNRKKILADEEKSDIVKVIQARHVVKEALKQTKAEEIRRQQQEQIEQQCTFKPKILTPSSPDQPTHGDRNKDLNSRVKQGAFKAKLDRDPNDVDYEKNKKECIHKPIINYSIYNSNKQLSEISGVDQKLKQMKAGQEQSQKQKAVHDRFGIVVQQKDGSKCVVRLDQGTTSMNTQSQTSKFKSAFGDPQELVVEKEKRQILAQRAQERKKPISFFEAVKFETSQVQDQSSSPKKENVNKLEPEAQVEIEEEREPKLYVDVNVANFGLQRIIVYEGDTVETLVSDFVKRCPIDEYMIEKLKTLLQQQIDGVLERIDEDDVSQSDQEELSKQNNIITDGVEHERQQDDDEKVEMQVTRDQPSSSQPEIQPDISFKEQSLRSHDTVKTVFAKNEGNIESDPVLEQQE